MIAAGGGLGNGWNRPTGAYLYCAVPPACTPPSGLRGHDDRPVLVVEMGPFWAWITEGHAAPRRDLEAVRTHHQVVQAAMGIATPVPVRFGAWAPDEGVLRQRLLERGDAIEQALDEVSGCVEFGLRVLAPVSSASAVGSDRAAATRSDGPPPAPPTGATGPGRTHLHALRRARGTEVRRDRMIEEAAARIASRLDGVARGQRIRPLAAPGLLSAAHLVGRGDADRYMERAEALTRERLDGRVVHVTGPWPPYSFAAP